jgi:transposase
VDPQLLRPIRHRSEQAQADLMTIRIRAALVEARTSLINAARRFAKAQGDRLPSCDADTMGVEKMEALPAGMRERLRPLLEQVDSLTEKIQTLEAKIEQIARFFAFLPPRAASRACPAHSAESRAALFDTLLKRSFRRRSDS